MDPQIGENLLEEIQKNYKTRSKRRTIFYNRTEESSYQQCQQCQHRNGRNIALIQHLRSEEAKNNEKERS